ncbi:putative retrotransposon gag domain, aspartic peptidase domain superfamily [Helianthus debilis subsp. tardiflorus]
MFYFSVLFQYLENSHLEFANLYFGFSNLIKSVFSSYQLVPFPGKIMAPQTRSNPDPNPSNPDPMAAQLAAIASTMESLQNDVAALKTQGQKKNKSRTEFNQFDDEESSWGNNRRYRPYNKIEFPKFSEGDPRGWTLKAEKYYRYYNIPEEEKVDVASMHLEGDALDLYSWLSSDQEIEYWEDLVRALQKNFGPAEFQNPDEHLCSIRQTGMVQEYRQEFAKRSSRVMNWPEHCLLGVFLNGLKEDLKADVRIHKPRTVYKAMSIALEFESKVICISFKTELTPAASNTTASHTSASITQVPAALAQNATETRISDAEKQNRYIRGECFRCGEKYGPGHRCKTGTFKLLETADGMEKQTDCIVEQLADSATELAEISLHALFGKPNPITMKLQGILADTEIIILIDSGSTGNFISDTLVRELKLTSQLVTPFGVQTGNGDIIRCSRLCKNVNFHIGDLQITQEFYPFSLGGADVVLGVQWLASLGTVQANWNKMFIIFTIDG